MIAPSPLAAWAQALTKSAGHKRAVCKLAGDATKQKKQKLRLHLSGRCQSWLFSPVGRGAFPLKNTGQGLVNAYLLTPTLAFCSFYAFL
jgi:hypothetical protein